MDAELLDIKEKILLNALDMVPFEGWRQSTITDACINASLPSNMGELIFSEGNISIIDYFFSSIDKKMKDIFIENVNTNNSNINSIREKIIHCIHIRLSLLEEHKSALGRTISYLLLPWNLGIATKLNWRSSDVMWRAIGDASIDYNYYTKRLVLSSLYKSVILYFLNDNSSDYQQTMLFVERNINRLIKSLKFIKGFIPIA